MVWVNTIKKRGGFMREYFSNAIIIGLAMAFLVHFCLIAKYGQQTIQEPNFAILVAEITLMIGLIAFGILGIVKYYKQENKMRK